jgi:hypothetical protein
MRGNASAIGTLAAISACTLLANTLCHDADPLSILDSGKDKPVSALILLRTLNYFGIGLGELVLEISPLD